MKFNYIKILNPRIDKVGADYFLQDLIFKVEIKGRSIDTVPLTKI